MKANQNGRECPRWCETGHSQEPACYADSPHVKFGEHSSDMAWSWARLSSDATAAPQVLTSASGDADHVSLTAATARDAHRTARFLDIVADAGPENIRALAEGVRQSAATAWPEYEPEAGQ